MNEDDLLRRLNEQNRQQAQSSQGGIGDTLLSLLPFGTIAKKAVSGETIDPGQVLTEAALTFLPIGKIAKGALGLAKGSKIAKAATELSPEALLGKTANRATQAGSGLKIGGGVGDLGRTEAAAKLFTDRGIIGTPRQQLKKIDETMGALGGQVDTILEQSPIKVNGASVRAQVQTALSDPLKYAELDLTTRGSRRALNAHLEKFGKATNAKEINDYIKEVNPLARSAQNKIYRGAAPTDKEMAALAAKKAGDEVLTQIPEIAPLKKEMAILFERNPEVAALAEKSAKIPFTGVQSQFAKQIIAGGQSQTGSLLNKLNQNVLGEAIKPSLTRTLVGQAGRRIGADALGLRGSAQPQTDQATGTPSDLLGSETAGMSPDQLMGAGSTQDPTMQYYEAAQRALDAGDPEAANQLLGFAKQFAALQPEGATMSAAQQKEAGKLSGAATSVDAIERVFDQAGGAKGRIAGTLAQAVGGLTGSGDVYNYEEFRRSQLAPLARAISGEVGTLTDADIARAEGLLPRINEDPTSAKNKFNIIRQLIQARQQNVSQNPGMGDGNDLLGQLNAAYQ